MSKKQELRRLSKQLSTAEVTGGLSPDNAAKSAFVSGNHLLSTSQPLLNLYLPSPSTPPASRPIAGAQRSRSQIDEKKDERKDNVVASGSLPNESPVVVIPVPHGNDTSSPLSSSSVSSSPSMSHESWSPAKPRALSRTSTGSAVSRRRSSDSKERDTNAGVIMQHRHSIATMEVDESVFPIPIPLNDDDSIRQHLKDLQKPVSRSRSDSLSRLRDSASGLITPAISSSLQQGTNNGSDGALSRISASLKNSSLRLPESLSGNNSPSGNGSSDPSPTVSPGASPRSRVPRTVMKAAEALEGSGGVDACKALLLDSRLSLVGSLFDTVEEDHWSSLAENLVIVFEQNRRSIKLMIWALRREIAGTAHVHDLFRLDSAASKLMGSYGQMVAGSYVKDLLKNMIVKKVPKLLGKSGPDDVSLSDIWKIIDSMLQTLVSKVSSAPFQLRVLCYYIKEEVVKRFPGKGNIGIGAFVFLRLICPAIVAPEVRGIVRQEPTAGVRKLLVRVARELQQLVNIANRGEMLSVELYGNSTEQVTFVGLNVERIKGFLDNIASKSLEESDTKKTVFSPLRGVSKSNSLTTSGDLESEEQAAMTAICDFVKIAAQKAESFKEKRKDSNNSQSLLNV